LLTKLNFYEIRDACRLVINSKEQMTAIFACFFRKRILRQLLRKNGIKLVWSLQYRNDRIQVSIIL